MMSIELGTNPMRFSVAAKLGSRSGKSSLFKGITLDMTQGSFRLICSTNPGIHYAEAAAETNGDDGSPDLALDRNGGCE
jgi:hypothetical protein